MLHYLQRAQGVDEVSQKRKEDRQREVRRGHETGEIEKE